MGLTNTSHTKYFLHKNTAARKEPGFVGECRLLCYCDVVCLFFLVWAVLKKYEEEEVNEEKRKRKKKKKIKTQLSTFFNVRPATASE